MCIAVLDTEAHELQEQVSDNVTMLLESVL
jgi:hypothetical protein